MTYVVNYVSENKHIILKVWKLHDNAAFAILNKFTIELIFYFLVLKCERAYKSLDVRARPTSALLKALSLTLSPTIETK